MTWLQTMVAKVANARLDWALQSDEPADLIEDLAFVLSEWTAREQALAALVAQWRKDAATGEFLEVATELHECADQLAALLSTPAAGG